MSFLRLAFPPFIAWILGGGLFWALHLQATEPNIAASDLKPVNIEPQEVTFALPQAQAYGEQLRLAAKRPLFSESRRIPNPEKITDPEPVWETDIVIEEKPQIQPEPPAFVLKGFVRNGDERQALLSLAESTEERWISKGDIFFEWKVQTISATSVQLERNGVEHIAEITQ